MNPLSRLLALQRENDATGLAMDGMRHRFEALRTRHEDGTAPQAVSAYQLFQTPVDLAARLVDLADIRPGDTVLEPSAGLGRLIDPVLAKLQGSGKVLAVEVSPELSGVLYTKYDGQPVQLFQRDFLTVSPPREGNASIIIKDLPEVHISKVVMNPPFHMRSDVKHVLHALEFLGTGGVLAGLCMAGPGRERSIRPLCDHWEEIPAGTFKEAGTNVATVLFRITKQFPG